MKPRAKQEIGQRDIHGNEMCDSDLVHCWSGDIAQLYLSESLRGKINLCNDMWYVGDNAFALGCAEYVEIINS